MAETVIPFGQNVTYNCLTGQRLVSDQDVSTVDVECQTTGEYAYPTWPQCTDRILCDETITFPSGISSDDHDQATPYYAYAGGTFDSFT